MGVLWGVAEGWEDFGEGWELRGGCELTDFSNLGTGARWTESVKMLSDVVSGSFFSLYFCSWGGYTLKTKSFP